ncbi:unnamed protein product [Ranitomeya imitator]|uniref:Uncharacterized protein n=1 Tax=Ranitomeya imitator TaxID=111125 RepID=A0ABN9M5N4_9NEOB|nr:unnamed protein product [Ranitomeya imitator]
MGFGSPKIGYISVIKMHFGTNLPAGRFGGRTAHAPAILQDGGAQGEDGRTDTGTPAGYPDFVLLAGSSGMQSGTPHPGYPDFVLLAGSSGMQSGTPHLDNVRKRWRSVTDRFIKSLKTPSGSSPSRKRVPFADQLQFILSSRNLRRTESNVYGQTPPDHEGDTSEPNIGEEVEDCRMVSQDSPGNMYSAGTSEDLTDTFGVMAIPANTGKVSESNNASTASDAASSSGGGVARHMGMGAASARPVALRRAAPKKSKKLQVSENLTSRTLNLLGQAR